jgi:hypothetical protein
MARSIRPAKPDDGVHLEQVVLCLKVARHHAKIAECPATLRKIRSAIKSAEGAQRHLVTRIVAALSSPGRPA